jgi:hypothetical protein
MTDDKPTITGLSPPDEPSAAFQAELKRIAALQDMPKPAAQPKRTKKEKKPKAEHRLFTAIDTTTGKEKVYDRLHFTTAHAREISPTPKYKPYVHYSDEIANSILSLMGDGLMLVEIARLDGFPHTTTMWRWMEENPSFKAAVTRARAMQGEWFAGEVKRIAQEVNPVTYQMDRVKMDAYKWLASKAFPAIYGDRSVQVHEGTVTQEVRHVIDTNKLSDEDITKLEDALRAANALPIGGSSTSDEGGKS